MCIPDNPRRAERTTLPVSVVHSNRRRLAPPCPPSGPARPRWPAWLLSPSRELSFDRPGRFQLSVTSNILLIQAGFLPRLSRLRGDFGVSELKGAPPTRADYLSSGI